MKYVHYVADIPRGRHFVILENTATRIPGDERSRTNPGHGYPERTEYSVDMQVTEDEQEWLEEVKKLKIEDPEELKFCAYVTGGPISIHLETKVTVTI